MHACSINHDCQFAIRCLYVKTVCYPSRKGVAKPLHPQTHTEPNLIANPRGTGIREEGIANSKTCKLTLTKTDPKLISNPKEQRETIGHTPVLVLPHNDNIREMLKQLWKENVDSQAKLLPTVPRIAISRNKCLSEYISKAITPYKSHPYQEEQFMLWEHIALDRDYPNKIGKAQAHNL